MIIITNFKTYQSAIGTQALKLAKIHHKIAQKNKTILAVAPSIVDIERICERCPGLAVFAQHVDDADFGSFTGKIPPEFVKKLGVIGTIINHSENRIPKDQIERIVKRAKKNKLKTIICVENVKEGVELMKLKPDFIAVEPPELIGGEISVSTANPEIISDAVAKIGKGNVIVGAGIKNSEDVKIAKKLGASGILLASGVTKASNPKLVLEDLVKGTK